MDKIDAALLAFVQKQGYTGSLFTSLDKKTGESALPEGSVWTYDRDGKQRMRMRITTKNDAHCIQERIETWKELHEEPKKAGCP